VELGPDEVARIQATLISPTPGLDGDRRTKDWGFIARSRKRACLTGHQHSNRLTDVAENGLIAGYQLLVGAVCVGRMRFDLVQKPEAQTDWEASEFATVVVQAGVDGLLYPRADLAVYSQISAY
jgi:hypothetical protein